MYLHPDPTKQTKRKTKVTKLIPNFLLKKTFQRFRRILYLKKVLLKPGLFNGLTKESVRGFKEKKLPIYFYNYIMVQLMYPIYTLMKLSNFDKRPP